MNHIQCLSYMSFGQEEGVEQYPLLIHHVYSTS